MSHKDKIMQRARSYPQPGEQTLAGPVARPRLATMPGAEMVTERAQK